MAEQCCSRRLTRMDVLMAAVAGLLLILLVPVLLAKPRERAMRLLCAANLSQIGKAMLIYADDYEGVLPRAGGPTSWWGSIHSWSAPDRYTAYGVNRENQGGFASISSCFYLLVRHVDVPPRLFVCRGDVGATEFKLSDLPSFVLPPSFKFRDAWDFGPEPERRCSYSYHMPFGQYALTTSRDSNLAVAADRNPWMMSPAADAEPFNAFKPDIEPWRGTPEAARAGNAITHERDGQNVLFLDGRVTFEKRTYCGVERDNIYTVGAKGAGGSPWGIAPAPGLCEPASETDSVLVHDNPIWPIQSARPRASDFGD